RVVHAVPAAGGRLAVAVDLDTFAVALEHRVPGVAVVALVAPVRELVPVVAATRTGVGDGQPVGQFGRLRGRGRCWGIRVRRGRAHQRERGQQQGAGTEHGGHSAYGQARGERTRTRARRGIGGAFDTGHFDLRDWGGAGAAWSAYTAVGPVPQCRGEKQAPPGRLVAV